MHNKASVHRSVTSRRDLVTQVYQEAVAFYIRAFVVGYSGSVWPSF